MLASGVKPDPEVYGAIIRKLSDYNRIQEALVLLDEASSQGLRINERFRSIVILLFYLLLNVRYHERNIRTLRQRMELSGMSHQLVGPDPEKWRDDASEAKKSKRREDQRITRKYRSMMAGN